MLASCCSEEQQADAASFFCLEGCRIQRNDLDDDMEMELVHDPAPPGMVGAYQISLRKRKGDSIGLVFDVTEQGLLVKAVNTGPVKTHNICNASATTYVYRQDFIVKVNGLVTGAGMQAALQNDERLNIDLVHPLYFLLNIDAKKSTLGLQLHIVEGSTALEVKKIKSGAVKVHNSRKDKRNKVQVGDILVNVNDMEGDADKMLNELALRKMFAIQVVRVKNLPPITQEADEEKEDVSEFFGQRRS